MITKDLTIEKQIIRTIYFGGGTPSILTVTEINNLLTAVRNRFAIAEDVEITLEANPDDICKQTLFHWKKAGINRLSLGVQSFDDAELAWMNRAHNASQSLQSIDDILEAGFDNFSVDLIYGSPLLTTKELEHNLQLIFEKNIPHVSCYALTVEPKTALHKLATGNKSLVDPGKQSEHFLLVMDQMRKHGYEHYEISNFARPGMRSRHNSSYWKGEPYYGFGPSAHSFNGIDKRRWNIANNSLYITSLQQEIIPYEEEILTTVQQLNEYIMISLRTTEGIDLANVRLKFGKEYAGNIEKESGKYIQTGKLTIANDRVSLTDDGKLFADGIAADLFV